MQGEDRPAPLNCLYLSCCKKHADMPRTLQSEQEVLQSRGARPAATACIRGLIRM